MPERVREAICGFAITAMFFLTGCASSSQPKSANDVNPPSASATNPPRSVVDGARSGVTFQVGDLVIIAFSDTPEPIPPHEERIKDDGNITLPSIGAVKAAGRSPGELQKEIHERYVPKYYLRLTVNVKYTQELTYSVLGEVRRQGPQPYTGVTTVTKAIGAASGFTDFASKSRITLIRANGTRLKVDYKKAIKDPRFDPQVFPGDTVNAERRRL